MVRAHRPSSGHLGFTLVDVLIVVALVAISITMAIPSLGRMLDTRRLHGVATELGAALHFARANAVSRNERVSASLISLPGGLQCHVVHTGPAASCACAVDGSAQCTGGSRMLRAQVLPAAARVTMTATSPSIHFDPRAGTATPAGRVVAHAPDGREVQHVVSLTGRVRACALPAAEGGHPRCPSH